MNKRQSEAVFEQNEQMLKRQRIVRPAVARLLSEWFTGEESWDTARPKPVCLYTHEISSTCLISVILYRGQLYFMRCFVVGDAWEISQDESMRLVNLKELADAADYTGEE